MKQLIPTGSEQHRGAASDAATVADRQAFPDNRGESIAQRKLMDGSAQGPRAIAQHAFSDQIHGSARMLAQRKEMAVVSGETVQRRSGEEPSRQEGMPVQRMVEPDEEVPQAPVLDEPVVVDAPAAPALAPALNDGIINAAAAMQARLAAPIAERLAESLAQQEDELEADIARMPGGTTDLRSYQNLLLDLTETQITEAIDNAYGNPFILHGYLANTLDYTSCYPAAERLLSLLGVTGSPQEQNGGQGPTIHGSAQQLVLMTGLTNAMQARAAAHQPTVFHIGLAGHGFILIVRQNRVEHLEAVAHSADLMESIENAPQFTMADIVEYLHAMVDPDEGERTRGADEMNWNAEPLGLLDPDVDPHDWLLKYYGLVWRSRPLAPVQEISRRVAARIRANRAAVITGLGL